MELDPDLDELIPACDALMQHLNEDDGGELVSFVYLIKQKITRSYERIDRYLSPDRLRPLLDQAIQGVTSCYKSVERDAKGFFQRAEKADAVAEVLRLLGKLSEYLASLRGAMIYSRENYATWNLGSPLERVLRWAQDWSEGQRPGTFR